MNTRNRKEIILGLLLATACGGNTVDLGHGGEMEWFDAPERGGDPTWPQTVFQSRTADVFGIAARESTLFALVADGRRQELELVSCPVTGCGSQRSVLYRSPAGVRTSTWLTSIVMVGDDLFWKLSNGEPLGIASCPKTGCETPSFIPLNIVSGDNSDLAADASNVFVTDFNGSLLRLSPGDIAPTVVRDGLDLGGWARLAAGDFVYFTSAGGQAIYRVRKDGNDDAELVARGDQITGLGASDRSLFYASQILDGSIVECSLGAAACEGGRLVAEQPWPAGVRVDGQQLFWATGFSAFDVPQGPNTRPASLWSCELPDCSAPRERVRQFFFAGIAGGSAGSLQPGTFTFSRDFVFWIEESDGARRIRRLAR